jgi:hypothetical protein
LVMAIEFFIRMSLVENGANEEHVTKLDLNQLIGHARRHLRCRCFLGCDDRHPESVAFPGQGFDAGGAIRLTVDLLSQQPDGLNEAVVGDMGAAPRDLRDLLLGDRASGVRGEIQQDVHRTPCQCHPLAGLRETAAASVKLKWTEPVDPRLHAPVQVRRLSRQIRIIEGRIANKLCTKACAMVRDL